MGRERIGRFGPAECLEAEISFDPRLRVDEERENAEQSNEVKMMKNQNEEQRAE